MTTAVRLLISASATPSNHLSLSSTPGDPAQQVMQTSSLHSPSETTTSVISSPVSNRPHAQPYQDYTSRPTSAASPSHVHRSPQSLPSFAALSGYPLSATQPQGQVHPGVSGPAIAHCPRIERQLYGQSNADGGAGETPHNAVHTFSGSKTSLSNAFASIGHHRPFPMNQSPEVQHSGSTTSRCRLFIRQQPRAARAGPDGKDRRAIDPPPILQLHMHDFDPDSRQDVAELSSPFWVVHCKLVAAQSPDRDVSTMSQVNEDGKLEVQRLLLGTTVASPTGTSDDPDPPTFTPHPKSQSPVAAPPSPTSRFLPISSSKPPEPTRAPHQIPGAFFIFADVSVRKAGEYRLQFVLMRMDSVHLAQGSVLPAVDAITSDVFRVVNAKDFDQVQPSTNLVKGLLDRGAGFPLKLKKGLREGQRRRRNQSGGDSDDDDSDDGD